MVKTDGWGGGINAPVPQAVVGPRDGSGVELYCNIKANPWLSNTPDIVYGLRVNLKLSHGE